VGARRRRPWRRRGSPGDAAPLPVCAVVDAAVRRHICFSSGGPAASLCRRRCFVVAAAALLFLCHCGGIVASLSLRRHCRFIVLAAAFLMAAPSPQGTLASSLIAVCLALKAAPRFPPHTSSRPRWPRRGPWPCPCRSARFQWRRGSFWRRCFQAPSLEKINPCRHLATQIPAA